MSWVEPGSTGEVQTGKPFGSHRIWTLPPCFLCLPEYHRSLPVSFFAATQPGRSRSGCGPGRGGPSPQPGLGARPDAGPAPGRRARRCPRAGTGTRSRSAGRRRGPASASGCRRGTSAAPAPAPADRPHASPQGADPAPVLDQPDRQPPQRFGGHVQGGTIGDHVGPLGEEKGSWSNVIFNRWGPTPRHDTPNQPLPTRTRHRPITPSQGH
jgi:hypothetical protein